MGNLVRVVGAQVGDLVRITSNDGHYLHYFEIGSICRVVEVFSEERCDYDEVGPDDINCALIDAEYGTQYIPYGCYEVIESAS